MTKALKEALSNEREFLKEQLIRGQADNPEYIKGIASAALSVTQMTYEDLQEGIRNDSN
mgnify:CR=1 FL=1